MTAAANDGGPSDHDCQGSGCGGHCCGRGRHRWPQRSSLLLRRHRQAAAVVAVAVAVAVAVVSLGEQGQLVKVRSFEVLDLRRFWL